MSSWRSCSRTPMVARPGSTIDRCHLSTEWQREHRSTIRRGRRKATTSSTGQVYGAASPFMVSLQQRDPLVRSWTLLTIGERAMCCEDGPAGRSSASRPGPAPTLTISSEGTAMAFVAELWHFVRSRKKYWLLPIILMMALFGGLIVLTQGTAVAPFIYTIF